MAIFKRTLCKGEKCRKWKHLNEEGYCKSCSNTTCDDEDELCGMCPKKCSDDGSQVAEVVTSSDLDMKIQCDLCEEWFHANCAGTSDFVDYVSREEPPDSSCSKGSLAVHMWFCSICVSRKAEVLKNLKSSIKSLVSFSPKKKPDENVEMLSTKKSTEPYTTDADNVVLVANDDQDFKSPKSPIVCKFYQKGLCRHGSSGKSLYNNRPCNFYHPKKCPRFCKFGNKPGVGCTNPNCSMLHPTLCLDSKNHGTCYNRSCTYQHLSGTIRSTNFHDFPRNNTNHVRIDNNRFVNNTSSYNRNVQLKGHYNYRKDNQYENQDSMHKPDFQYSASEFPPLNMMSGGKRTNNIFSMEEFAKALKDIQLDLQALKKNQQFNYSSNIPSNPDYNRQPTYQEAAKNLISPPVTYNQ